MNTFLFVLLLLVLNRSIEIDSFYWLLFINLSDLYWEVYKLTAVEMMFYRVRLKSPLLAKKLVLSIDRDLKSLLFGMVGLLLSI